MTVVPISDVQRTGAIRHEDFTRRLAGLPNMQDFERDRFTQRLEQQNVRDAQLEQIDADFSDQMAQAEEMENTLRAAGLSDVADRYRRRSRSRAFNAARRGLAGGSADIEQQARAEATAQREGEQVAEQARLSALEQVLKAQQQRDKLAGEVIRRDPFQAGAEQFEAAGVRQAASDQGAISAAQRQLDAARRGGTMGIANIIGGGLGNLGSTIGGFMRGSA